MTQTKPFIKNVGQFHPEVQFVANDARETGKYRGSGAVIVTINDDGSYTWKYNPHTHEYAADDPRAIAYERLAELEGQNDPSQATRDTMYPDQLHADVSCGDLVVAWDSRLAAIIENRGLWK
jgi:hypothetical protein